MILKDPVMEIPRAADCFVGFDKYVVVVKDQFVDIAANNWAKYVHGTSVPHLPKSVPLKDIELLKRLSKRICILVNKDVAHLDRRPPIKSITRLDVDLRCAVA